MFFFLDFLFQRFGQVAIKYFTDFMPVIYLPYIFNSKNSRVCVLLSVYNIMKYFTEIVAPRTFSKIILSHSFPLFFFFFFLCRYIFWKLPIICARVWPCRSKKLYWILKFWNFKWFLTNFFGLIAFTYRHKQQQLKIVFLSLAMSQWNISLKFRNFECFWIRLLPIFFLS